MEGTILFANANKNEIFFSLNKKYHANFKSCMAMLAHSKYSEDDINCYYTAKLPKDWKKTSLYKGDFPTNNSHIGFNVGSSNDPIYEVCGIEKYVDMTTVDRLHSDSGGYEFV